MRYLNENCIPISTCLSDPAFFHNNTRNKNICFVDKNNIMNGIREEALSPLMLAAEDHTCGKECQFKGVNPNCPFLVAYSNYLMTIDFNSLLVELERTAEEVRKVTQYTGEPIIVLLVYEAESNPCSERVPLQNLFKRHNIDLKNLNRETQLM
jgi:hypothetical protein